MKKLSLAAIIALMVLICVAVFAGCNTTDAQADMRVTAVQIQDIDIYMAPTGEPSTFQLEAWVMPSNATNKALTYKILDYEDRAYLTVDSSGKITALREKEEGIVVIRIASSDNPSAYVDVRVTVEIVAVKKISFVPAEVNLLLGSTPTKVTPIFTPYHAILGRNVSYQSLNEQIATVDSQGNITPVGVGITTIWVIASNDQNVSEEQLIKGNLQLTVDYTQPNYKLSIANPAKSCRQIIGATSEITLALDKLDTTCDPSPTIRWRVAGAPIPLTEDFKVISYNPTDLPRGEYQIQATITDKGSQTQVLYSQPIYVYEMLKGIDIMVYNTEEELSNLAVNDILRMEVSFSSDQYPPDNYKWTVYRNGISYETKTFATKTFNYQIKETGAYRFTCEAIIQGNASGVSRTTETFTSGEAIQGNDINNVYITARKQGTDILPYLAWDAMHYNATYTVRIQTSGGGIEMLTSTDPDQASYFTGNGVFIPASIATLSDSFSATVRSGRYGWTETLQYNGNISIGGGDEQFFDIIVADFDGYIQNMEEMGQLLNYINVFRPQSILKDGAYEVKLKVPFTYSSVSPTTYPLPAGRPITAPAYQDIMDIIFASFNCYGDSVVYTPSAYFDTATRVLELSLRFDAEDEQMTATDPSVNAMYTNETVVLHYSTTQRSGALPIDGLARSMSVSTSMQLYYAVALGYKPVPVQGSSAQLIYDEARNVSRRIINNNMTDAQKVHAIYDFLTAETIYDRWLARQDLDQEPNKVYESFHLEGVFLRKLAVCDGISKAFTLLCGIENITAIKVNGTAGDIAHAWNKTLIDGVWYVSDATWGSYLSGSVELQSHRYMLATDAAIQDTHTPYGKQVLTATTPHTEYYRQEVAAGIDATITSEAEVTALVLYMLDRLTQSGIAIRLDFVIGDTYYASLGQGVQPALSAVVMQALAGNTGLRYSVEAYNTNKYASIKIENLSLIHI